VNLALDDGNRQDGLEKINVHGKLVSLPTRSSSGSSTEELAKALNLGLGYRVHLYASDHLRYSILMTMLNQPISYAFMEIRNAGSHEIAIGIFQAFKLEWRYFHAKHYQCHKPLGWR
jgi:hypothetical protein